MEKFYTSGQIAKMLQVGYRKILNLIHLGNLRAYKIDGQFRIPISALHEYLEKSKYKSHWKK